MAGPDVDREWQELRRLQTRVALPRYDRETFHACMFCLGGPTAVFDLSGELWAMCAPCLDGWHVGSVSEVFDPPCLEADEIGGSFSDEQLQIINEEMFRYGLVSLASCTTLRTHRSPLVAAPPQPALIASQRRLMNTAPSSVPVADPNLILARGKDSPLFTKFDPEFRSLLFTATLSAIVQAQERPQNAERVRHFVWERIRGELYRNKRVDIMFRDANVSTMELDTFIGRILRQRDVRESLLALREQINEALAQLEPLSVL